MINHKEAEILAYLIKRSPSNNFIVIEPQEIVDNIESTVTKEELLQFLSDLSSRDAIEVRIVNMDECVLKPTPKASVLIDELNEMEEAKKMINTVKKTVSPVVVEEKPKKEFFKKTEEETVKPKTINEVAKIDVNYKRIFWSAFSGAMCGGGIIAVIMLIINLAV